jgi:hypothetical protein
MKKNKKNQLPKIQFSSQEIVILAHAVNFYIRSTGNNWASAEARFAAVYGAKDAKDIRKTATRALFGTADKLDVVLNYILKEGTING